MNWIPVSVRTPEPSLHVKYLVTRKFVHLGREFFELDVLHYNNPYKHLGDTQNVFCGSDGDVYPDVVAWAEVEPWRPEDVRTEEQKKIEWTKDLKEVFDFTIKNREKILQAFIAETGLLPSECVLVEEIRTSTAGFRMTITYVRRRDEL